MKALDPKESPAGRALALARKNMGGRGLNCVAEIDESAGMIKEEHTSPMDRDALSLWGVPVLIKDNIDVRGLHTTAGSLALCDNLALKDAPVVSNLRRHGAVIIGKTNMTEFANFTTRGMPNGYSSRGGQVLHAAGPGIDPSGSSSGSGVAVAAGIVPMAVGTDTSFSVIACARANGICGLKPPVGVLPGEGIVPIAPILDSAGPMARSFSDALRLYGAMRDEPLPEILPADSGGLRIAVNRANAEKVPDGQNRFIRKALERLKRAGGILGEVDQPPAPQLMTVMTWEFKPALEAYLSTAAASRKTLSAIVAFYEAHPDTMMRYGDQLLREALDLTPGGLDGAPYREAMAARADAVRAARDEIGGYDAVIMTGPTTVMHFCGLPSCTVAGGETDENGVRRCLILYGADEMRLWRAALAVEALIG